MRYMNWPLAESNTESTLVLDKHRAYPKEGEEYCGIFGYNQTLYSHGFLAHSNRYNYFQTSIKGQERIFISDIETKEVRWLNFLNKAPENHLQGEYELQNVLDENLLVKHSANGQPPIIYLVSFKSVEKNSLSELID